MDGYQFTIDTIKAIASVLAAIAWPIAFVVAVFIFREPLTRLLGLLRHLKYKDLEADFAEALPELAKKADAIELPDAVTTTATQMTTTTTTPDAEEEVGDAGPVEEYAQLSEVSPRSAIVEAWISVEQAIEHLSHRSGGPDTHSIFGLVNHLRRRELLSKAEAKMIQELRSLRNRAAHSPELAVSSAEAFDFAMLALRLAERLREK